jgi:hypothetical protein
VYLRGLIHRDRLFEIATRWLSDRLEPQDARFVTQVFVFESLILAPSAIGILRNLGRVLDQGPYCLERLRSKDQVRRLIEKACPEPGPRMAELFQRYRRNPEEFFPRTPVDMIAATRRTGEIVGMMRVKQIRRIAEKASRRVADRLASEIWQTARLLAEGRARASGVGLSELVTSPGMMAEEFFEAERAVSLAFREGEIAFRQDDLRVDDVIAVKFVGSLEKLDEVERAVSSYTGAAIAEREVHTGDYNDVNILVDLELPPASGIIDRMRGFDWSFAASRGLDPSRCLRDFEAYVESGARTFRIEIILTTLEELVESEFGLSTHEERVLSQRHEASYSGRIAQNASYIIHYLILLALSPVIEIDEIPIKMWGRYLEDTISLSIDDLFGVEQGQSLFTLFAKHPLEIPGTI